MIPYITHKLNLSQKNICTCVTYSTYSFIRLLTMKCQLIGWINNTKNDIDRFWDSAHPPLGRTPSTLYRASHSLHWYHRDPPVLPSCGGHWHHQHCCNSEIMYLKWELQRWHTLISNESSQLIGKNKPHVTEIWSLFVDFRRLTSWWFIIIYVKLFIIIIIIIIIIKV